MHPWDWWTGGCQSRNVYLATRGNSSALVPRLLSILDLHTARERKNKKNKNCPPQLLQRDRPPDLPVNGQNSISLSLGGRRGAIP